jgi:hypothetical protein
MYRNLLSCIVSMRFIRFSKNIFWQIFWHLFHSITQNKNANYVPQESIAMYKLLKTLSRFEPRSSVLVTETMTSAPRHQGWNLEGYFYFTLHRPQQQNVVLYFIPEMVNLYTWCVCLYSAQPYIGSTNLSYSTLKKIFLTFALFTNWLSMYVGKCNVVKFFAFALTSNYVA